MTPARRKKHLQDLKDACKSVGFEEDRWGNFLHPKNRKFRIKFKSVNVRVERKSGSRWVSAGFSKPYSKVTLREWNDRLAIWIELF